MYLPMEMASQAAAATASMAGSGAVNDGGAWLDGANDIEFSAVEFRTDIGGEARPWRGKSEIERQQRCGRNIDGERRCSGASGEEVRRRQ